MRLTTAITSIIASSAFALIANISMAETGDARLVPNFSTHYQGFHSQPFAHSIDQSEGKLFLMDYAQFHLTGFDLEREKELVRASEVPDLQDIIYNTPGGLNCIPQVMALNKDRTLLAITGSTNEVVVIDVLRKSQVSKFQFTIDLSKFSSRFLKLAFDYQNNLVVENGESIFLYDVYQKRLLASWAIPYAYGDFLELNAERTVAWGANSQNLLKINLASRSQEEIIQIPLPNRMNSTALAFGFHHATGQVAVSYGPVSYVTSKSRIDILDINNPTQVLKSFSMSNGNNISIVRWSPDGRYLFAFQQGNGSYIPGVVSMIDSETGEIINTYNTKTWALAQFRDLFFESSSGKLYGLGLGLWVMDTGVKTCIAPSAMSELKTQISERDDIINSLNNLIDSKAVEYAQLLAERDSAIQTLYKQIKLEHEENKELLAEKDLRIKNLESEISNLKTALAEQKLLVKALKSQETELAKSLSLAQATLSQLGCKLVADRYVCPKKLTALAANEKKSTRKMPLQSK